MITGSLFLISSWLFGKGDFDDGKEPFLFDSDESLLFGFKDINNLFLGDVDDLVKPRYFSSDDFSDPECPVDKSFGGFDGHELFVLAEEESESPGDILS